MSTISTSRRNPPLWESVERVVNDNYCSIGISLDDDKFWLRLTKSSESDLLYIKYRTHVRASRIRIVAHTTVTKGAIRHNSES